MSKILYGIAVVLLVMIGITFAILNAEQVQLNYYFGSKQIPLSFAIILSIFIGAILGVFASIGLILKSRKELSRLRKTAEMAEKEISNLRAIPIKNRH